MPYPKLIVDINKIKYNGSSLVKESARKGIEVVGVTKVVCGNPTIAQALVDSGIKTIADSRVENLKKLSGINCKKMLLRIPMPSQSEDAVRYSDIVLVSEILTIKKLSEQACIHKKSIDLILMIDLGDLREGLFYENEILKTVSEIIQLKNIKLLGLGTNLSCYGAVIPSREILEKLVLIKNKIKNLFNINLEILSGGNSGSIRLFEDNQIPSGINQLRLGASIILGIGIDHLPIDGLSADTFILEAEIIELRKKPSKPVGKQGLDAFGNKPVFIDMGIRSRAICAIGRQDVNPEDISPLDNKINILGGSSDHLILDVTDCKDDLRVGDTLRFKVNYGGCLSLMTSPYVYKEFL
ncbi:ornithine racemase Orr [uncultured Ilyobacter sp.]|uniref:ornithine racemase Orr n=1 Tax=uncultured Ilyobacter sp. TaxID=544433 RepID=UPI0029C96E42|nr:ornithine racemase Orr [uncultured Ilyobacter sp.]